MQRNKEEIINGTVNKENTPNISKVPKPPIERPHDRKPSNINPNPEPILNKSPTIQDGDKISEPKSNKPKSPNDQSKLRTVKNIGFENLPDQIYRRSLFNGFEFNLMVVGCSGLGKSTFVNTLFLTELYDNKNLPPSKRAGKTVSINTTTVQLVENAVSLKLTLIDTPGFGDHVDNTECWGPVLHYIEAQYTAYMHAQNRVERARLPDTRVHACLYFLEPTGHGLKPLDLEFMQRIHNKVNVIPIIAKADSLVPEECAEFKRVILQQIRANSIRIYEFPEEAAAVSLGLGAAASRNREAAHFKDITGKRLRMPFAVVCSNALIDKSGGAKVRARSYPWGLVEVDNLEHNDFAALRTLLLSSHLQDIKDVTDQVHFENYRCEQMSGFAKDSQFGVADGKDPMSQMDQERREFEAKNRKMEEDMEVLFEHKVSEKTRKLEEFQMNIERTEREMQMQLESEIKDVETRRGNFEAQRLKWEETNRDTNFRASMDALDVKEKNKSKSKWLMK